jgi:hypothetical protein
MESNHFIEKLARWDLILIQYDFDIVHKVGRVNRDVDGLSWNSSFSKEDIIEACCHGDRNLEVVSCWDAMGMYLKLTWVMGILIIWTLS